MEDHICKRCGLATGPTARHLGPSDCWAASRSLADALRHVLRLASPTEVSWEFNSFDTDPEDLHRRLTTLLGESP